MLIEYLGIPVGRRANSTVLGDLESGEHRRHFGALRGFTDVESMSEINAIGKISQLCYKRRAQAA